MIRFQIVGWGGVLLNLLIIWLLYDIAGWSLIVSATLAIEASIIHNFTWYYFKTWHDRVGHSIGDYFSRLIRFNVITASIELLVKVGVIWFLTQYMGMHYLLSDLISMLFGPIFKYTASEFYIFKPPSPTDDTIT